MCRQSFSFRPGIEALLPSSFGDDHFCAKLMKAVPQFHIFKSDFWIIWPVIIVVIWLKKKSLAMGGA